MSTHATQEYHSLSPTEVLDTLDTTIEGLSAAEAAQRLSTQKSQRPTPRTLRHTWRHIDPLLVLQVASGTLLFALDEPLVATALFVLALLHASLAFLRESARVRPSHAAQTILPHTATVIRDGDKQTIATSKLVIGDIVYLQKDTIVPADLRLIEEDRVYIDSASITGSHANQRKCVQALTCNAPLADRHNSALCGAVVTAGEALGVVTALGTKTVFAQAIATNSSTLTQPVLHHELHRLHRILSYVVSVLGVLLLPLAALGDLDATVVLLFAATLVAAAIPFGLPGSLTLLLAQAAGALRRSQVSIKRLRVIEQLSTVSILLTDTTELYTTNKPLVREIRLGKHTLAVGKTITLPEDTKQAEKAKKGIELLATAAAITVPLTARQHGAHDPHEHALLSFAHTAGVSTAHLDKLYREMRFFPHDSTRDRLSTVRYYGNKKEQKLHVFVRGSVDSLLARCTKIWDDGRQRNLTAEDKKRLRHQYMTAAKTNMECSALAFKILPSNTKASTLQAETAEQGLTWLGTVTLQDPLRKYITNTLHTLQQTHIKVTLLHPGPAQAAKMCAVQVGLAPTTKDVAAVSAEELRRMSNSHVLHLLADDHTVLYALTPTDRERLVRIAHQSGKVVAVNGTSTLDVAAIQHADLGFTAARAPHVVRAATALTLLDSSITSLAEALLIGRSVFQNIRVVVLGALTSVAAKLALVVLSLGAATLMHIPPALTVIHLLLLSLVVELIPLAALGTDTTSASLQQAYPRNPKKHLLDRDALSSVVWPGILISLLAFGNYLLFFGRYEIPVGNVPVGSLLHLKGMTLVLITTALCLCIAILHQRSPQHLVRRGQLSNGRFWLGLLVASLALLAITQHHTLSHALHLAPLQAIDWLYAAAAALVYAVIRELQLYSKKHSRKAVLELHRAHRLRAKQASAKS